MKNAMTEQVPVRSDSPTLPVMWAACLIGAALLAVAGARIAGVSPSQDMGPAEVVQSRLLRFVNDANGGVTVVDAATSQVISQAGKEGFIPGVLRGLDRLRRTSAEDPSEAYRLERLSNGQLLLIDAGSGLSLDLAAYGSANASAVAAFLSSTGDKS